MTQQPSTKKYTYVYSPLASTPEEFYEKFVITNPNLNHAFIRGILDQVINRHKSHLAKWAEYQRGKHNINIYSFIQNSDWISKEYFNNKFANNIVDEISNFDYALRNSTRCSFDTQFKKLFRPLTIEESKSRRAARGSLNPWGYAEKLHSEEHLVIERFLNGESVTDIRKTYNCSDSTIRNIVSELDCYQDMLDNRRQQEINTIKARKLQYKNNMSEKKAIKAEAAKERKRIREEAKLLAQQERAEKKKTKLQIKRVKGIPFSISEIFDMGEVIDKDKIYSILKSKPHNEHYLKRYLNFVFACMDKNSLVPDIGYTEIHHICPKSKDLFPQYFGFTNNPWNKAVLTGRQHFIAHWMLWKAYGGSQAYAFKCLCNQKSQYQLDRYNKLNPKSYELLKIENSKAQSKSKMGMASYKDSQGQIIHCSTTHEKVLSGEYISLTKGRKQTWAPRTEEQIRERNRSCSEGRWKSNPIRTTTLYFLDMKITMTYTKGMPELLPFLDQGWTIKPKRQWK